MEWWLILLLIFLSLIVLFSIGLPIAFAFFLINMVAAALLWNGVDGINQLVLNMYSSLANFSLLAIPMFILMGEIMFRTGLGQKVFDVLGKWMGKTPGRLSILSVGSGTLFAVLSGSSVATTALLGSLLVPDMIKKGYKISMSVGPILGSAGLATMIPPTALGVLLASLAGIPVGQFLVAIFLPGIILAILIVAYIIIRCILQPDLAPGYDVEKVSLKEKVVDTIKYILPLGVVLFFVLGVIILGVATPTQSAVLGAISTIILSWFYGGLSWKGIWDSLTGTLKMTVMIFTIMLGSATFGQILSYTGVTSSLVEVATSVNLPPLLLLVVIQIVLLILGCFMEPLSIMMMTLPVLMPISQSLGFDPIWFGVIMLLNMQMATMTPPFGMDLFAMRGVAPESITMKQIYNSAWPFIGLNALLMILMIVFPQITLWLPSLMK